MRFQFGNTKALLEEGNINLCTQTNQSCNSTVKSSNIKIICNFNIF